MNYLRACCMLVVGARLCAVPVPPTKGRVLDAITCQPVAGVGVFAVSASPPGRAPVRRFEASADDDGNYEFTEQHSQLTFEREGYRVYSRLEPWHSDCPLGTNLMMQLGTLSGTVVDESGSPIARAAVTAESVKGPGHPWRPTVQVTTDEQGKFTLQLDPFETHLTITDPRCGLNATGLLPGDPPRRRPSLYQKMVLGPGQHREVKFTLRAVPAYTVSGTIENHVDPFPSGAIELRLDATRTEARICPSFLLRVNQAGGAFSISGVPDAKYGLAATLHRETADCDYCSGDPSYRVYREVEVAGMDVEQLRIEVHPGLQVSGGLHWEGNKPPKYGYCWPEIGIVSDTDSYSSVARDGSRDSLRISNVQPGLYRLKLTGGVAYFRLLEVRLNDHRVPPDMIVVTPEMREAKLDLYLSSESCH